MNVTKWMEAIEVQRAYLNKTEPRSVSGTDILATAYLDMRTNSRLCEQASALRKEAVGDGVINIRSFGEMFGINPEGYVVVDVQGFPDPQGKGVGTDGTDPAIQDYVLGNESTAKQAKEVLAFAELNALYGKNIAFRCYAGKNRSVAFAEVFAKMLADQGFKVDIQHITRHLVE